jgi:tRNA(fMet)-specific endonuclease VapC
MRRITVLHWDSESADLYGPLRADLERRGKPLAPLDLMIAAHALSAAAVLVASVGAFRQVANLAVEDWARA